VDYSSAFNTILPSRLFHKMTNLGLDHNICRWIKDFLTNRPQSVKMGPHHSSFLSLSTGVPQGCVLSPFLYSLYTHDCTPTHNTNVIIKFADDTTVVGLVSRGDETAYREEVQKLTDWYVVNNLAINLKKTKELIVDFRRKKEVYQPLVINGGVVERVSTFKFLGTHISEDLTWKHNTSHGAYFLRVLRKVNLSQRLLISFYRCSIESVLSHNILVWNSSSSAADKKALQRVIKAAQKITNTTTSFGKNFQLPFSPENNKYTERLFPPCPSAL